MHDAQAHERIRRKFLSMTPLLDERSRRLWVAAEAREFAVRTIRRWWDELGTARFPLADELLITADGGGSNSS